jgi:hypothetical protein
MASLAASSVKLVAGDVDMFSRYFHQMIHHINQMERIHWIGLSVVVLVVGIGCMRGLNTRM